MFEFGQVIGGAAIALGIAAIAGYFSKRYWVAALVGAGVCFVSVAPIETRIASALTCVALIGLLALARRARRENKAKA